MKPKRNKKRQSQVISLEICLKSVKEAKLNITKSSITIKASKSYK